MPRCATRRGPRASASWRSFRLKRILVPLDFSDCAKKALRYAIPLAQEHKAALTLLYVVPPDYVVGEYGVIDYAALRDEARAAGERKLAVLPAETNPGAARLLGLRKEGAALR